MAKIHDYVKSCSARGTICYYMAYKCVIRQISSIMDGVKL